MIVVDPKGLGVLRCLRVMNAIGGVLRKKEYKYKHLREHDISSDTIYYSWVLPNELGTYSGEVPAFVAKMVPKNSHKGYVSFYVGFGIIRGEEGGERLIVDKIISEDNLLEKMVNSENHILKEILTEAGVETKKY